MGGGKVAMLLDPSKELIGKLRSKKRDKCSVRTVRSVT